MLGTVDVFMLSRISDTATGAVGLANEIIYFCILMFGFVGIGTSVAVSQYIGADGRRGEPRLGFGHFDEPHFRDSRQLYPFWLWGASPAAAQLELGTD
ncbi:hypothetical protein HMSSN139_21220 [Paenibacillus sp. HMSSN-139]|nr:hypothetical protein HMSSN139_21220 [Paenibacillus sp. HMSSN-139]